jgi:uncharacterized membrane protein
MPLKVHSFILDLFFSTYCLVLNPIMLVFPAWVTLLKNNNKLFIDICNLPLFTP